MSQDIPPFDCNTPLWRKKQVEMLYIICIYIQRPEKENEKVKG